MIGNVMEATDLSSVVLVLCMEVDNTGRGAAGSVGTAVHCFNLSLIKVCSPWALYLHSTNCAC